MRRATLTLLATLAPLLAALGPDPAALADDPPVVIEDRIQRLTFRAPGDFLWSPDSSPAALCFDGPKAGSAPSRLWLMSWPDGRDLADVAAAIPVERLVFESPPTLEPWEAAADWPGVDYAVQLHYTEKRKDRISGVLMRRQGPRVVTLLCDAADKQFDSMHETWAAAAAAVELEAIPPAYVDAPTGLTFYELPPGFEVDEPRTTPGVKIAWVYAPKGQRAADLLVIIDEPVGDQAAFDAWAAGHVKRPEGDGKVTQSSVTPFVVNGAHGWLLEALISYGGGNSIMTRYEVVLQDAEHRYSLACYAEATNFAENMRPVFERFLRSITLGSP